VLKQGIIKLISLALLFAIVQIAVPLQEIFHVHHAEAHHHNSCHETAVSSYEKPCCKPVKYFHKVAAILNQQHFTFFNLTYTYKYSFYTGDYSRTVFSVSNKAPPANLS